MGLVVIGDAIFCWRGGEEFLTAKHAKYAKKKRGDLNHEGHEDHEGGKED